MRIYQLEPSAGFKNEKRPEDIKPILTLEGHSEGIKSIDFSPDGKLLITAASDCKSFIFNVDM